MSFELPESYPRAKATWEFVSIELRRVQGQQHAQSPTASPFGRLTGVSGKGARFDEIPSCRRCHQWL